jgi:hypothetical protein
MTCSYCGKRKVVMVGNELYLGRRGRQCCRYSVKAESPATVVGFSRQYEYLMRVRFEGQKTVGTFNYSHFCHCTGDLDK